MTQDERMQARYQAFNRDADPRGLTAEMPVTWLTEGAMSGIAKSAGSFSKAYADKRAEVASRVQALADAAAKHRNELALIQEQGKEDRLTQAATPEKPQDEWYGAGGWMINRKTGARERAEYAPLTPPVPPTTKVAKWEFDNYSGASARPEMYRKLAGVGVAKVQSYDPEGNPVYTLDYNSDQITDDAKTAIAASRQMLSKPEIVPGTAEFNSALRYLENSSRRATDNTAKVIYDAFAGQLRDWAVGRSAVAGKIAKYISENGSLDVQPAAAPMGQVIQMQGW